MLDKIARQKDIECGELHLGYLYYDADFYIARIREAFRNKYPRINLYLHPYQPAQLEEALLEGKLDAAILYGVAQIPLRDLNTLAFLKIPYSLIYNKSHRLSRLKDLSIMDLDGEKLIIPEKPFILNHAGDIMNQMLKAGGASISETIPVFNYDEVPWILQETGAIYISPMVNPRTYGSSVEIRYLMPNTYQVDVSIVWRKDNQNPAITYLNSVIKSCYP